MSSFSLFLQKVLFSKGNLDPIAPSYDAELLFVIKDKSIGETKPVMTEFPKLKCQGMLSHLSTWVVSFAVCSFLDPFAMLLHLCVLEYSNLVDMFFFICAVYPGELVSFTIKTSPPLETGPPLCFTDPFQPNDVIEALSIQGKDEFGNNVEKGPKVRVAMDGLAFQDKNGPIREVRLGFFANPFYFLHVVASKLQQSQVGFPSHNTVQSSSWYVLLVLCMDLIAVHVGSIRPYDICCYVASQVNKHGCVELGGLLRVTASYNCTGFLVSSFILLCLFCFNCTTF
jgi:hypothetical protein